MAFYIQHTSDRTFAPWYASNRQYASRLFMSLLEARPYLNGHLEIVEVDDPTWVFPEGFKVADRPYCCSESSK